MIQDAIQRGVRSSSKTNREGGKLSYEKTLTDTARKGSQFP